MRACTMVSVFFALVPFTAHAFAPITDGTVIPGPPAAAPQVALTASTASTVCQEVSAQQGVNTWVFNAGNRSFYYVLNPSHGTNPNLQPPLPQGHNYNPVGSVRGLEVFAQADCGAQTGALSKKVYYQDYACWPGTSKHFGTTCLVTSTICPPGSNATLVEGDCRCLDPLFPIEDAAAKTCRPDPCASLDCDDGLPCTLDTCDSDTGCINVMEDPSDVSMCTCDNTPPVMTGGTGAVQVDLPSVGCPVIGGDVEFALEASGSFNSESATCSNECISTSSTELAAELSISLCGKDSVVLGGEANHTTTREHLRTCDPATCGSGCGAGHCETSESDSTMSLAYTRFAGVDGQRSLPGAGSISFKCGGTLKVEGSHALTARRVEATGDAPPCVDCFTRGSELSAGGEASFACVLNLAPPVGVAAAELGCKDCGVLNATLTGSVERQSGSCGTSECWGARSDLEASVQLPAVKARFLWWSVKTVCKAGLTACGEGNSCGTCTCGDGTCRDVDWEADCYVCGRNTDARACD